MKGLAAASVLCGCSYSFAEPPAAGARTLRLTVFENRTRDRGLEAKLATALARELALDGRLRLVSEGGDLVLTGTIVNSPRRVLFQDEHGDAVERQLVLECSVDLLDAEGRHVLKGRKVSSDEVDPAAGLWDLRRGEYFGLGAESAVTQLARGIARLVLVGW